MTLLQAEEKVKPMPADIQKQIADKIEAKNMAQASRQASHSNKKSGGKKSGGQKNKGSASDYMGSKK